MNGILFKKKHPPLYLNLYYRLFYTVVENRFFYIETVLITRVDLLIYNDNTRPHTHSERPPTFLRKIKYVSKHSEKKNNK